MAMDSEKHGFTGEIMLYRDKIVCSCQTCAELRRQVPSPGHQQLTSASSSYHAAFTEFIHHWHK